MLWNSRRGWNPLMPPACFNEATAKCCGIPDVNNTGIAPQRSGFDEATAKCCGIRLGTYTSPRPSLRFNEATAKCCGILMQRLFSRFLLEHGFNEATAKCCGIRCYVGFPSDGLHASMRPQRNAVEFYQAMQRAADAVQLQ